MVKYDNKEAFLSDAKKGEIVFANHKLEFLRFFESHKKLCDEIAGLKYFNVSNFGEVNKILISRENFIVGIRKLNSFIIDYLHYIEDKGEVDEVLNRFETLENDFINDEVYNSFVKKKDNLSNEQEINFSKKYINYLVKAFDISYLMSKYLQKSLNIASREIVKNIQFVNYDGFFNNLSVYREEVANELSNLQYENIFDNFKKLMGYFYTYRYLISNREQIHIRDLLRLIHNYITLDETIRVIIKIKDDVEFSISMKQELRNEFIVLRNAFNKIYYLCNYSLSMKNILPKSKTDVLVDNTLI